MVVGALVPPDAARVATRAILASQQCTRMPQNDAEEPFPPICVHSCAPMSVRNGATVYTNAPKRLREVIFANLCTLLCPHGRSRTGRGHGSHDIDGPMALVMLAQVLGPDAYAAGAVTQPPTRTHFIVAGYRIPSRPQLASGVTLATGPTGSGMEVRRPSAMSRRRCATAPAERAVTRRRRLTHISPTRPHPVTHGGPRTRNLRPGAATAPPAGRHTCRWCEKCAPDGVPAWVFAGRRKRPPARGALLELLGSTRLFMRGPSPPPRRPKGGLGARAGLASCAHEARWGALLYNSLATLTDIPWASGGESMSLPAKLPLRGRSESQGSRRSRGTRPSSITPATTEDPESSAVGAEGRRQPPGSSGTPRWERPGALPAAAPGLACPPTALLLAGTRSLWREMRDLAVASPLARPWVTSLSNTPCELASPSRAGHQQSRCGRRAR